MKKDKLRRIEKNLEKDESEMGINSTNIQSNLNFTSLKQSFNVNNMNNYTIENLKDSQADITTMDNLG